jgi:hypothetical protein
MTRGLTRWRDATVSGDRLGGAPSPAPRFEYGAPGLAKPSFGLQGHDDARPFRQLQVLQTLLIVEQSTGAFAAQIPLHTSWHAQFADGPRADLGHGCRRWQRAERCALLTTGVANLDFGEDVASS